MLPVGATQSCVFYGHPLAEPLHIDECHRRGEQRERLGDDQATDHGDT
jgi:hypothetical protein